MSNEDFLINYHIIDSKNDLLNKIDRKYILGLDAENPREFYIINLLNKNNVKILEFGLFSQICGIKPKIIIEKKKTLY